MKLTAKRLRELLHYDPATGVFRWKVDIWSGQYRSILTAKTGEIAGGIDNKSGYRRIRVDGGPQYKTSRIAWLYMTGEWPPKGYFIDHKDGNKSNDCWKNLRLATPSQNAWNSRKPNTNASGYKGVHRYYNRFIARITINGNRIELGRFPTPELAHRAYKWAARRHFGEFARTR